MNVPAYLQALNIARAERDFRRAKVVRWLLLVAVFFICLWAFVGLEKAAYSLGAACAFALWLFQSGYINAPSQTDRSEIIARYVEEDLLRHLTSTVAPWLHIGFTAPSLAEPLGKSGLMREDFEFARGGRCLAGVHGGETPFCAAHVEVGRAVSYKDADGKIQHRDELSFQGLVVLVDFARAREGWVTLASDRLEALGWAADEWRGAKDPNYVRMENPEFEKHFHVRASGREEGYFILSSDIVVNLADFAKKHSRFAGVMSFREGTLTAAIPMKTSPFLLRNNENYWPRDVELYVDTAKMIVGLIESLHPEATTGTRKDVA
jgi:hypothetical protein